MNTHMLAQKNELCPLYHLKSRRHRGNATANMSKCNTPFKLIIDLLISCSILCFHTLLAQVALVSSPAPKENTRLGSLRASHHSLFTNQSIYNLDLCVFLFKERHFNIYVVESLTLNSQPAALTPV